MRDLISLRKQCDDLQFDDPINVQFTSGTTGLPKGATLTHDGILNSGFFVGEKKEWDLPSGIGSASRCRYFIRSEWSLVFWHV